MSPPEGGKAVALILESDGPGGAEVMVLTLAAGLVPRGYRPLVVLPITGCGWLAARCRERGIRTTTFVHRHAIDPGCLSGLARIIRQESIDVVHSHEFTMGVYGAAAAAITGRPHISTLHGQGGFLGIWRNRVALRWALNRSAARVVVSAATGQWLASGLGIPPARFQIIPNGVEERPGDRSAGRRSLEVSDQSILLLAVGNLYPVKGHRVLIEALGRIVRSAPEGPDWRLCIAGEGKEREPLTELAREFGIGDRVSLLGHRSDIPDLLAAADLFVMPSFSEGTPLSLLEAMVAGKPIVATAVGGIPDVIVAGQSGLLVPAGSVEEMGEALRAVLASPEYRERLGCAAQARGREFFHAAAMVDRYEELYRRVLTR